MYISIIETSSKFIIFGSDAISPMKEITEENKAVIESDRIFPIAISLLFVGVTRRVAIVPLSFSPAMDSVATLIQPENKNTTSKNGAIIVTIISEISSFVARS